MELWFTEKHNDYANFSIKVIRQVCSINSKYQRIDVLDTYDFGMVLVIDGYVMLTEKDEFIYHEMITHVPMAVNPFASNVLVIGGGDGGTLRELIPYKTIKTIDIVEIDKSVIEISKKYLPFTSCGYYDNRVTVHIEDGVEFVNKCNNSYDLIIVDSTDPIGPGEGLFTLNFYERCFQLLKDEGILVNQSESAYYNEDRVELIRAQEKLKKVFPLVTVYQCNIPTYPSGHWLFGFASKKLNPIEDQKEEQWERFNIKTKYYNSQLHKGAFYLPNYIIELL